MRIKYIYTSVMLCYVIIIRCCWLLLSCSNTIRHVEAAEDVFLTTLHTVVYFSMFLYRLYFYYIISLKPCSLLGCTGRNSTHIKSPPRMLCWKCRQSGRLQVLSIHCLSYCNDIFPLNEIDYILIKPKNKFPLFHGHWAYALQPNKHDWFCPSCADLDNYRMLWMSFSV